ncbi:hypothetical protein [uncultured Caulobacter sp.]|uniref:hypothetical protein n=1 Tax=uncultured Caulobacter sp. TaxID=158749 RepID=UPI0026326C8C|nr:hypothetical protein [uncultured Caulobacter sp.]
MRFRKTLGQMVMPMIVLPFLVLKAFRLHDGAISASDFLWYAAIVVPALFLTAFSPWLEDRRLRRLKQERREQRRPFLNLEG